MYNGYAKLLSKGTIHDGHGYLSHFNTYTFYNKPGPNSIDKTLQNCLVTFTVTVMLSLSSSKNNLPVFFNLDNDKHHLVASITSL